MLMSVIVLLFFFVVDAELGDERLLQDVGRRRATEDAEVTRAAELAEQVELERAAGDRECVFAELGQIQNALRGPGLLVAVLEIVERELVHSQSLGSEPGPVDILQVQPEVPELGRQVPGVVVERRDAADP